MLPRPIDRDSGSHSHVACRTMMLQHCLATKRTSHRTMRQTPKLSSSSRTKLSPSSGTLVSKRLSKHSLTQASTLLCRKRIKLHTRLSTNDQFVDHRGRIKASIRLLLSQFEFTETGALVVPGPVPVCRPTNQPEEIALDRQRRRPGKSPLREMETPEG